MKKIKDSEWHSTIAQDFADETEPMLVARPADSLRNQDIMKRKPKAERPENKPKKNGGR